MIVSEFVKRQKILRLTTIGPTGIPHTVPVWYAYRAKKFYVGTNTGTAKAKNLLKNSRVAFCIDVGTNAPGIYGMMGQGRARLILEDKTVRRIATRILLRYFKTVAGNGSAQQLLEDTDCIIEISPDRIAKWHY